MKQGSHFDYLVLGIGNTHFISKITGFYLSLSNQGEKHTNKKSIKRMHYELLFNLSY
ncbi:hypothetical protein XCR1_1280017 [Xenorhabdus cabanillasii JM26]|uniref:Uncharacterized protein n=1 Tax=Xenorhabdus cabanillasii JM26 TaxID=1427517 RepID=W1IQ12_9GAMM|nr:hypothetical protein XCR1_1280017 [Xenorhabdus cabanillasii JM26]